MKTSVLVLAALATLGMSLAELSRAERITLSNGDRLSGKLVSEGHDAITLETAYAGRITIPRIEVVSITSDAAGQAPRTQAAAQTSGVQRSARAPVVQNDAPASGTAAPGISRKGRVNLSAAYARGNSTTDRIHGEGEFTTRARQYRYSVGGRFTRAKEAAVDTASNALGQGNYDWFLDQGKFVYVRGSVERDRFKDIKLRAEFGGGYGLQLIDTDVTDLSVRAGPDLIDVRRFQGENESYPALGWGAKYSHWLFNRRAELFHEHEGFWNLRDTDQVTVRSRTGLRFPLTDRLNASAQVNLDWEREPAAGRKSTDAALLLGLGYTW